MTKIALNNVGSLVDAITAQTTINNNNAVIVTAFDNTLSRNGLSPNTMGATLDMNSNAIINLPVAVDPTSPVRLLEVGNAPAYATAAAASATASAGSATAAATSATNAATSATTAQSYITGLSGTSSTSVLIGTGANSFTANTGKLWVAGNFITVSSNANSANYMHGSVTSYNSGTGALVTNILDIGGSGTFADWNINITGTQGPLGPVGPSGAVGVTGTPTANQFATWNSSTVINGVAITGLVKGNGASAPTAAVSNTDYLPVASPTFTGTLSGPTFDVGNADTTIARLGAGQISVEGVQIVSSGFPTPFTQQQYYTLATITDAANLVWTVSSGQKAKVTLGGNRTMNAVTGAIEGATYILWVIQDATGSRTITWTTSGAGSFDFGAAGAPTLTTTLSKADILTFEAVTIAGTLKLRFTGIMRGFA